MKPCIKCDVELEIGKNWCKSRKDKYNYICNSCYNEFYRAPDRHMKKTYGMNQRDYDAVLKSQGGGCAICGTKECSSGKNFAWDHVHHKEPLDLRGLLCGSCNIALGKFKDNVGSLMNAIHYLNRDLHKIKREA